MEMADMMSPSITSEDDITLEDDIGNDGNVSRFSSKKISRKMAVARKSLPPEEYDTITVFDGTDGIFSIRDDTFQQAVARKSNKYLIGQREAELRVMIDRIIAHKGGKDEALLFVVSNEEFSEKKVQIFSSILLHQGASPTVCDSSFQTPLHHAVRRNFCEVSRRLLENGALPHYRDKYNNLPFKLAVKNNNDELAAMLLDYTANRDARGLFVATEVNSAEFSCKTLLDKNMEETMLSLLGCMIDRYESSRRGRVYYHMLESDSKGRTPSQSQFDKKAKSVLYHIAKHGSKNIIYHDAVRLLLRKKWKDGMKLRFLFSGVVYLFTLFALLYSLVVASGVPNPVIYDTPLQISRAVFEVIAFILVLVTFALEINQFRRHRLDYWRDKFNWLDMSSVLLLIAVLPLRFTDQQAQWHVYSIGYLLWTLRIFKYSAVFRQTGAYAQILWRVLYHDIVQFMALFIVILLAFSGAFLLALRGENALDKQIEISTFWWILFTGLRTMVDTEPIENYYTLPILSVILMVIFLFICIVVMLNLLIAQLSDTYQNIQQDAQRGLELNRAWIVTRIEINSLFMGNYRVNHYKEMEEYDDIQDILDKWESPPLNDIHWKLRKMDVALDNNNVSLTTLTQRLAWQEKILIDIQEKLATLTPKSRRSRHSEQTSAHSDTESLPD